MKSDILTLIKEISILREENTKLRNINQDSKYANYSKITYKMIRFMSYLARSPNKHTANRAQTIIQEYLDIKDKHNPNPTKKIYISSGSTYTETKDSQPLEGKWDAERGLYYYEITNKNYIKYE